MTPKSATSQAFASRSRSRCAGSCWAQGCGRRGRFLPTESSERQGAQAEHTPAWKAPDYAGSWRRPGWRGLWLPGGSFLPQGRARRPGMWASPWSRGDQPPLRWRSTSTLLGDQPPLRGGWALGGGEAGVSAKPSLTFAHGRPSRFPTLGSEGSNSQGRAPRLGNGDPRFPKVTRRGGAGRGRKCLWGKDTGGPRQEVRLPAPCPGTSPRPHAQLCPHLWSQPQPSLTLCPPPGPGACAQ